MFRGKRMIVLAMRWAAVFCTCSCGLIVYGISDEMSSSVLYMLLWFNIHLLISPAGSINCSYMVRRCREYCHLWVVLAIPDVGKNLFKLFDYYVCQSIIGIQLVRSPKNEWEKRSMQNVIAWQRLTYEWSIVKTPRFLFAAFMRYLLNIRLSIFLNQ